MSWGNFLNLLEGAPVAIGVPKNHYSEDVMWRALTPICCASNRESGWDEDRLHSNRHDEPAMDHVPFYSQI